MARDFPLVFYNVRVGRDQGQVEKELRAILNTWRPAVLGLCEATGYSLPGVEDFVKIRDTSTKSRANIAAYVKASLELDSITWMDLKETWSRTEHPGTHEPRSYVKFRAGKLAAVVAHQPPKGTDNTQAAQSEGITKLTSTMAPWTRDDWDSRTPEDQKSAKAQARVVLWDANRGPTESGPGPKALAANIGGTVVGSKIDGAVIRQAAASQVIYADTCGGCELKTDHAWGAFRFTMSVG